MARWLGLALAASAVWVFLHLVSSDFLYALYNTSSLYGDQQAFMLLGIPVIFLVFWAIFRDTKKST